MGLASCIVVVVFALFMMTTMASSLPRVHMVGDSAGWTIGLDYKMWASAQTFYVGDALLFEFNNKVDNVLEVSKADFLSCNSSSPMATYASGSNTITLRRPGHYYFITCSSGHCKNGQKLEIKVKSAPTDQVPGVIFQMSPASDMNFPAELLGFVFVLCIFFFFASHILTPVLIFLVIVSILLVLFTNLVPH